MRFNVHMLNVEARDPIVRTNIYRKAKTSHLTSAKKFLTIDIVESAASII